MAWCGVSVMNGLYKVRLMYNVGSKTSLNSLQILHRANSILTSVKKPAFTFPFVSNPLPCNEHQQDIKCPKHSTSFSGFGIFLPSLTHFTINSKKLPSMNFEENIINDYFQEGTLDIEDRNNIRLMGSLLKKRRRKMNRQKYKKRRKRDRFKREALKNLREKKRQRKERAAERKQAILSNMVVNKSISKRRARYLSHKLLPGVIKGQGLA